MMQRLVLMFIATVAVVSCTKADEKPTNTPPKATVITAGLKFCEGSLAYGNSLLVSNFGGEELNPLNTNGKGYIVKVDGTSSEVFIANDGSLSAPKGMAVSGDYLFIADVEKVVVYNLKDKAKAPQIVAMPAGNLFVNDIVIAGQTAYISVTNTGKIFTLDISNPAALSPNGLSEYAAVVGANGLVLDKNTLFIASYPADDNTTADNVIYIISDLSSPKPEKLISREGQYDGLAVNGNKLYFSSWVNGEIGYVDLSTKKVELMQIEGVQLTGPADISILQNTLCIPNLPASEVVFIPL